MPGRNKLFRPDELVFYPDELVYRPDDIAIRLDRLHVVYRPNDLAYRLDVIEKNLHKALTDRSSKPSPEKTLNIHYNCDGQWNTV